MKIVIKLSMFLILILILVNCSKVKEENSNTIKITVNGTIDEPYFAPTWSPDGRYIAFIKNGDLYIADQNGKNIKHLKGINVSCRGYKTMQWSLDSKYLAMLIKKGMTSVGVLDIENWKIKSYFSSRWLSMPVWNYFGNKQSVSVLNNSNTLLETPPFKSNNYYNKKMRRKILYQRSGGYVYIDENDSIRKDIKIHRIVTDISHEKKYFIFEKSSNLSLSNIDNNSLSNIILPLAKDYYPIFPLFNYDDSKIVFNIAKDSHYSVENYDIAIYDLKNKIFKRITDTKNKQEAMPSLSPDNNKIVYEERTDGNIYMIRIRE